MRKQPKAMQKKEKHWKIKFTRELILKVLFARACLCGSNQDFAILRGTQVVYDAHQVQGLGPSFLCLGHVEVHFIAIKVGIVGAADALIEAQRPAQMDTFNMKTMHLSNMQ